jgi:hypothetical protein
MVLAWSSAASDREDHGNIGRINLLLVRDAHCPGQTALGESLPERAGQPITSVGQVLKDSSQEP